MSNTVDDVELLIPGQGHIFYAEPGTEPFDPRKFEFADASTYADWTWLGDSQQGSPISFSKEGGETTIKGTHDRPQARSKRSPETLSGTINLVGLSRKNLELAFPGGSWEEGLGGRVSVDRTDVTSEVALMYVPVDGGYVAPIYMPKVSLSGTLPQNINEEEFLVIELGFKTLQLAGKPYCQFWPPVQLFAALPVFKNGATYEKGTLVRDAEKNAYKAKKKVTNATTAPSSDTTNWEKIS